MRLLGSNINVFKYSYNFLFSESKTYTVFAPTDAAFARLSPAEMAKLGDRTGAKAFVAKHVVPGTLYSAGMRYYQLRNSMEDAKPLTLQKNAGKFISRVICNAN